MQHWQVAVGWSPGSRSTQHRTGASLFGLLKPLSVPRLLHWAWQVLISTPSTERPFTEVNLIGIGVRSGPLGVCLSYSLTATYLGLLVHSPYVASSLEPPVYDSKIPAPRQARTNVRHRPALHDGTNSRRLLAVVPTINICWHSASSHRLYDRSSPSATESAIGHL